MSMKVEKEFNHEEDHLTHFEHSLKLTDDNYIFITKTHANMPLTKADSLGERKVIERIKSYFDVLVQGTGLSDDAKYLLSLLIKKAFSKKRRAVYLTKNEYFDFREISTGNRCRFSDSFVAAFHELHSTVFQFSRNGFMENYSFLEFSSNKIGTDYFKAVISKSYIDLIIKDKFYAKTPVSVYKKYKSDFIKDLYNLISVNNFSSYNYLDVSEIGFVCEVNGKTGNKLNESIKRAFMTLEKIGVIKNVKFYCKETGRKEMTKVGYAVVSQYKNADGLKIVQKEIDSDSSVTSVKKIEPCIEDFDEEPVVTYRKEQTSPVLPIFTNSFDDLNDDDPLPF